jgi:hypothetical protein
VVSAGLEDLLPARPLDDPIIIDGEVEIVSSSSDNNTGSSDSWASASETEFGDLLFSGPSPVYHHVPFCQTLPGALHAIQLQLLGFCS